MRKYFELNKFKTQYNKFKFKTQINLWDTAKVVLEENVTVNSHRNERMSQLSKFPL